MDTPFADLVVGNKVQMAIPAVSTSNEMCQAVETRLQAKSRHISRQPKSPIVKADSNVDWTSFGGKSQLVEEQERDPKLDKVRSVMLSKNRNTGDSYFANEDGMLYRIFNLRNGEQVRQIVVPKKWRNKLLSMAHDIPSAGHLGNRKTRQRLMQHFFWPGIFGDVAQYCRSCPQCQKSIPKGRVGRAPHVDVPPMDEPFLRVAIDIVGPLPRSQAGNKYILVCCDYVTRYPEAVPLKNQEAETVADALVGIFSRVGIPKELLSDQGTNFMSELIQELCRLLQIRKLTSTPYHPQTNGLVERFNGTLKGMLRCYAQKDPGNWDKQLPYVLFAYREVPHECTGFSPFEMLYGRHVRGPLAILRETWEEPGDKDNPSIISYILETRARLAEVAEQAQTQQIMHKKKQKLYYDRRARHRNLEAGQKVLVLLPTSSKKLLAQWKGPYEVVNKTSPVDYQIKLNRNRLQTFHINMLKRWFERDTVDETEVDVCAMTVTAVCDVDGDDHICNPLVTPMGSGKDVHIDLDLQSYQRNELLTLCESFSDVLCDVPGKTSLIDHKVETGSSRPIYQRPYAVPHALQDDEVQKELQDMLEEVTVEPSNSPWAAPIVLVKKKVNTIRFCVDYRKLNEVTVFDPNPMPNVDDIHTRLASAKYFSSIDLTKGYWKIPLDADAKRKTAFVTSMGHFQFTVLPFGMVNSGASFVRFMHLVLAGTEEFTDSYIDDIIVFSDTWEQHLSHLRTVLGALRNSHLTAKPSKCFLGYEQLEFLVHIVGGGTVAPVKEKVRVIRDFPEPTTKRELRSFLGMVGYYRKFIPNFSQLAAPLTDMTGKGYPAKVIWTDSAREAFQTLRHLLTEEPVLRSPDFSKRFILQTDASDRGLGAVLLQEGEEGRNPVFYLSRKLLPRAQAYAVIEKECQAIVWAVQKLKVYLNGVEFVVETDHCPLQWLHHMKNHNQRLLRWSLILQEFKFTTRYLKGKENALADQLPRIPALEPEEPSLPSPRSF